LISHEFSDGIVNNPSEQLEGDEEMFENVNRPFRDEEDDEIFVNGALLDADSVDSAIDALARDEVLQADEALD
jgi:hypothetical protein